MLFRMKIMQKSGSSLPPYRKRDYSRIGGLIDARLKDTVVEAAGRYNAFFIKGWKVISYEVKLRQSMHCAV